MNKLALSNGKAYGGNFLGHLVKPNTQTRRWRKSKTHNTLPKGLTRLPTRTLLNVQEPSSKLHQCITRPASLPTVKRKSSARPMQNLALTKGTFSISLPGLTKSPWHCSLLKGRSRLVQLQPKKPSS